MLWYVLVFIFNNHALFFEKDISHLLVGTVYRVARARPGDSNECRQKEVGCSETHALYRNGVIVCWLLEYCFVLTALLLLVAFFVL